LPISSLSTLSLQKEILGCAISLRISIELGFVERLI
jgi:hypothetical protein